MSREDVLINSYTRLWRIDESGESYHGRVAIWRILWNGGKERVILTSLWGEELLMKFPDGCNLEVMGGKCLDPMDYSQGKRYAKFENCIQYAKWIPIFSARSPIEESAVKIFIGLDCKITLYE